MRERESRKREKKKVVVRLGTDALIPSSSPRVIVSGDISVAEILTDPPLSLHLQLIQIMLRCYGGYEVRVRLRLSSSELETFC